MARKNDPHIQMINTLNAALKEDPSHQTFALSSLILDREQNQLSFISCASTDLWHLAEGSKQVRILNAPNRPLGTDLAPNLLETLDNWHIGDTLILHSLSLKTDLPPQLADDTLSLSPQTLAEKILVNLTPSHPSGALVLSLLRL